MRWTLMLARACVCMCVHVDLYSSLKVSCLEAQQKRPLVAAVRRNTEVDLEEDVEEDSDSQSRFFLWSLALSLAMISLPRINIENTEHHLKGDCHHISVVCSHSHKGLPVA